MADVNAPTATVTSAVVIQPGRAPDERRGELSTGARSSNGGVSGPARVLDAVSNVPASAATAATATGRRAR